MLEIDSAKLSIMKKFFSILAAFFLGLFISISIIACADNDDDSSMGQLSWAEFKELRNARLLKVHITNSVENYEYKEEYMYDDQGRISSIHVYGNDVDDNYTMKVTYSGNTILIVGENDRYEVTVSEGAMMVPYVVNEFIRDAMD